MQTPDDKVLALVEATGKRFKPIWAVAKVVLWLLAIAILFFAASASDDRTTRYILGGPAFIATMLFFSTYLDPWFNDESRGAKLKKLLSVGLPILIYGSIAIYLINSDQVTLLCVAGILYLNGRSLETRLLRLTKEVSCLRGDKIS